MRIGIYTLGCKVNQFETQALEAELAARGHEICAFDEQADAYIINTCAVTGESGRKSRQAIRRARKMSPDAVVAVCGCYSQIDPGDAVNLGADLIAGSGNRTGFVDLLEEAAAGGDPIVSVPDPMGGRAFERLRSGSMSNRTRAMLKVEDGCSNFCSYCIIPYARGPVRSLPLAEAADEARRLAGEGFLEIVVTGIEISSYGTDLGDGTGLDDLLRALCGAAPGVRIRLGSLDPAKIDADFCRSIAGLPNLCPHFHPSLQSGCDETLRRMRRGYDTERYFESVELLRSFFPGCSITTDLIVGFPQESDEEFSKTLEFIKKCNFADMHIFPYSKRPGTRAAEMDGQIARAVKSSRAHLAAQEARGMKLAYLKSCVGSVFPVLFEQENGNSSVGHAPNYTQVSVPTPGLRGKPADVLIERAGSELLFGRLV